MDAQRFDSLARMLATGKTRRSFVKSLAGGLLAAVAGGIGVGAVEAARCREPGNSCEKDAHCCSGSCAKGKNGRKTCVCPEGTKPCKGDCIPAKACCTRDDCPASPDACHRAACTGGACGLEVTPGRRCDDGDRCTTGDVCQADGTCHGTPKDCSKYSDACNEGVCDPASGDCRRVPAHDGAVCPGKDKCFTTYACQAGSCVGRDPVVCTALDQCHEPGQCSPATGSCSNPNAPDGTSCNDDNTCTSGDTCQAGVCTGGKAIVCTTDNPCLTASCDPAGGCFTSPKPQGVSCSDDNPCNGDEVCDGSGGCVAGTPILCVASDQCHDVGVCDPATGTCTNPPIKDGTDCSTGNLCVTGEICRAGVCTGGTETVCSASDVCHDAGTCDPTTGFCSNPDRADDAACDDGNACTETDTCQAGVCTPGTDVVCQPLDDCHVAGTCDPQTGVCSDPVAADETPCGVSDDLCYRSGLCFEGSCYGAGWVNCYASDDCHDAYCDNSTGECVEEESGDGSSCDGPDECQVYTCQGGVCQGEALCASPEICLDGDCCIPDGSPSDNGSGCCSDTYETITGLCIRRPLGAGCDRDSQCGAALDPACCDGHCVDLDSNRDHCGSCNNPTPTGGVCLDGNTSCFNFSGQTVVCGDTCADLSIDLNHCGSCDHACNIGSEVCSQGHCCPVGYVWGGTRCCPLTTHEDHGLCCAAGFYNSNGICCPDRWTNCGGTCVDTDIDLNNCGGCGVRPPTNGVCLGGVPQCFLSHNSNGLCCPFGQTNCGGTCRDLQVDLNNCGACGVHAPAGGVCLGGVPQCTAGFHNSNGLCCGAGLTNCGGSCVSTTVDLNNCGGCGVRVPVGGSCTFGNPVCPAGSWNDNGRCCFNTERNCGNCCTIFAGAVCPC